jgi:hypothetical protein
VWGVREHTSGAIQYGVPFSELQLLVFVAFKTSICFEAPKSANFTTPRLSTKIFAPLMFSHYQRKFSKEKKK